MRLVLPVAVVLAGAGGLRLQAPTADQPLFQRARVAGADDVVGLAEEALTFVQVTSTKRHIAPSDPARTRVTPGLLGTRTATELARKAGVLVNATAAPPKPPTDPAKPPRAPEPGAAADAAPHAKSGATKAPDGKHPEASLAQTKHHRARHGYRAHPRRRHAKCARSPCAVVPVTFHGGEQVGVVSHSNGTITAVIPGSQADLQGVRPGWVEVKVGKHKVENNAHHLVGRAKKRTAFTITFEVPLSRTKQQEDDRRHRRWQRRSEEF
mmetsp:Transcript_41196/g.89780  ORF Transcript_41196/g.89780 Transcript_41196/m.89780 type:complete len:267 (+) Transcript_41196:214-1014(+)